MSLDCTPRFSGSSAFRQQIVELLSFCNCLSQILNNSPYTRNLFLIKSFSIYWFCLFGWLVQMLLWLDFHSHQSHETEAIWSVGSLTNNVPNKEFPIIPKLTQPQRSWVYFSTAAIWWLAYFQIDCSEPGGSPFFAFWHEKQQFEIMGRIGL